MNTPSKATSFPRKRESRSSWTDVAPAYERVTAAVILVSSGGPKAHEYSVESHVVPAKAGIQRAWVPAYAGTTAFVTFISMGGPQAHGHSEGQRIGCSE
jgi:hypothetical protein